MAEIKEAEVVEGDTSNCGCVAVTSVMSAGDCRLYNLFGSIP